MGFPPLPRQQVLRRRSRASAKRAPSVLFSVDAHCNRIPGLHLTPTRFNVFDIAIRPVALVCLVALLSPCTCMQSNSCRASAGVCRHGVFPCLHAGHSDAHDV
eukprot:829132-Alexandrium_andersonii.AAC.1